LVKVDGGRAEIFCVLFDSDITSKVFQGFVPQGKAPEKNSQEWIGIESGAT